MSSGIINRALTFHDDNVQAGSARRDDRRCQ
jgi:hypothetical protein